MRLVVDASAIVPFVTDEQGSRDLAPLLTAGHELHVPAVCDCEVVGGLAKQVRSALAEVLDARLVTLDGALGRAVRQHTNIEVLP